jgi:hypothetical protein
MNALRSPIALAIVAASLLAGPATAAAPAPAPAWRAETHG